MGTVSHLLYNKNQVFLLNRLQFTGKRTPLEEQLIIPTILSSKSISDLTKPKLNKLGYSMHILTLTLLEIVHVAYLLKKQPDILEFATLEQTITAVMEVS